MILCGNPKAQYLSYKEEIDTAIFRVLNSGWYILGKEVEAFENEFARYIGVSFGVGVGSGTEAIHLALAACGIGPGDEVITVSHTAVATVAAIELAGAIPVLVDVDIKTWNIAPENIKKHITKKTKAIIPVHLFGNPCNMEAIGDVAKKHGLYIIEDATESLGAKYKGKYTGTLGNLGCLSFNGNKMITTGGGGLIVGDDLKRLEHVKFLVNQARDVSKGYFHPELGFNYRMTNLEAALGLAQMERLEWFLEKKKTSNKIYRQELGGLKSISFQDEYQGAESCWWLTCIVFEKEIEMSQLQNALKAQGIPTRRIFMPIVEFPPYIDSRKAKFANSYYIYERGLCLPSSTLNSENDVHYVCKILKELVRD